MANFLTWASDVLEKVDQSAAHLSDGGLDRGRRRRKVALGREVATEGETAADGHLSDLSGYGSDLASDWKLPAADFGVLDGDAAGSAANQTILQVPSGTMRLALPNTNGSISQYSTAGSEGGVIPPWELPLYISSAVFAAKAPSLSLENLRIVRRKMEGEVWQQSDVRKEFDDVVRQTNEVEAKVSAMAGEVERLQQSAGLLLSLNARELAQLREEAMAAQGAYGRERNAHSATRIQSQMRESSLAAENVAYAKALAGTEKHAEEKASEGERLEARIREMKEAEQRLQAVAAELKRKVEEVTETETETCDRQHVEGESWGRKGQESNRGGAEGGVREGRERGGVGGGKGEERDGVGESEGGRVGERHSSGESQDVRNKRLELAAWDAKLVTLEREVELHQQSLARWPSTGQREKELERRLRGLNEQLVVKQAQAEALANERAGLQLRLDKVQEARKQLHSVDGTEMELKRSKLARSGASGNGLNRESGDDPSGKFRPRSTERGVSESMARVARTVDALSLHAGAALQRNSFVRSLIVVYVLGLHVVVFVILALAAAQKALGV